MRRVILAMLVASAAAHADPAPATAPPLDVFVTRPVGRADVGRFLRDSDGEPVGSIHAVYGDTAVVWLGFFREPGNHLVTVPLSALQPTAGGITADIAALEALPEYKPRCADLLCFSMLTPEPPAAAGRGP